MHDYPDDDDRRMLEDAVGRYLERQYDLSARRRSLTEYGGFNPTHWAAFAHMGLLGLAFPELYGGAGLDGAAVHIVMEAFGRRLVIEPYTSTVVQCGQLILHAGIEQQKQSLLSEISEGKRLFAFAYGEPQTDYSLHNVQTTAHREGDEWVVNGYKHVVLHGAIAQTLIVSARTNGAALSTEGISLFLVDRGQAGVSISDYQAIDGTGCADIRFERVRIPATAVLGRPDEAFTAISLAADVTTSALCAEAVGAMSAIFDATLEHVKTRYQFGTTIGSFQVIKHRMADMLLALEQARSLALLASCAASQPDAGLRQRLISAAKIKCSDSGRFIGQQGIHLHGGMGMTDELPIGLYVKRLIAIEHTLGDARHHLLRYTRLAA
jgi:alkylation response protein AidB-like acyl-CoA dehydrogenase